MRESGSVNDAFPPRFTFHVSRRPCRLAPIRLCSPHPALLIALRQMREGQRSARAIDRLEGNAMSALWFTPALEKILRLRLLDRQRRRRCAFLHRHASLLRHVRAGQAALVLTTIT